MFTIPGYMLENGTARSRHGGGTAARGIDSHSDVLVIGMVDRSGRRRRRCGTYVIGIDERGKAEHVCDRPGWGCDGWQVRDRY